MKHSLSNLRFAVFLCISPVLMAGAGILEASAADAEAREGKTIVFKVKKPGVSSHGQSNPFISSIRYSVRTENGTANAGDDYEAVNRKVVFPAGTGGSQKIRVRTILDNIREGDGETFRIILSDPKVYDRYCKCYQSKNYVPLPAKIMLTGKILEPEHSEIGTITDDPEHSEIGTVTDDPEHSEIGTVTN